MFRSKQLSQNFITSSHLAHRIVSLAKLNLTDTVLEIGPGKGILTAELAIQCGQLICVEIDQSLVVQLQHTYAHTPHVHIHNVDFLTTSLPLGPYKVFANIPFHITAQIMHKLLHALNPPTHAYLIMQKEAAEKFSGNPFTTKFSASMYPYYQFETLWHFKRTDFTPSPNIDTVLLKITKREIPLIPKSESARYQQFLSYAFGKWKPNLKLALKDLFTYTQWKRVAHQHNFSIKAKPSELSNAQWIILFKMTSALNYASLLPKDENSTKVKIPK